MKQTKQKIKACLALLLTAGMLLNRQVSAGAIQNQIDRTGQKINDLKDAVDETDKISVSGRSSSRHWNKRLPIGRIRSAGCPQSWIRRKRI